MLKYSRRGYVTIERPVDKLVVLLPNEEDKLSEKLFEKHYVTITILIQLAFFGGGSVSSLIIIS